jgi:hypothetical protein
MKFLNDLIKKPDVFQRTVGLSIPQFSLLAQKFEVAWSTAELTRKTTSPRKRSIGSGRPYKLMSIEQKFFVVLLYYKTYATQEFIGILAGLNQANISRLLSKTQGLISQIADPELGVFLAKAKEEYDQIPPQDRINQAAAFFKKYPELKEASTDATEQHCHRSHDYEIQKNHFSGKKRMHTVKTQISVASNGRILDASDSYPGSIHDKKVLDQEGTISKFPESTCQRLDSGYQGVIQQHPQHYLVIPIKKPHKQELPVFDKELNRMHSKLRVIVENAISRLKKFKILNYRYRGLIGKYNLIFKDIAAILNFRLDFALAK